MEVVVIGAGFAGVCVAWLLRERHDARVTLLEGADLPGGMLRTLYTEGGLAYEYGPRVVSVFRGTPDVLPFLRAFADLEERSVYQATRLRPEYPVVPFPVDRESVRSLPCGEQVERELAEIKRAGVPAREGNLRDYLESTVGPTLTELAFEGFNRKFWGRRLEEMPADWGKLRRLERIADEGEFRLPSQAPHYYPVGGFNPIFEKILAGCDVRYGVRAKHVAMHGGRPTVVTDAGEFPAELVVSTAPIDAIFGFRFGHLEWRGYRIEVEEIEESDGARLGSAPDGTPFAWLYTPWAETPVCRTTDFGVLHNTPEDARREPFVLTREIVDDDVKMYPVWWEAERFDRYLEAAAGADRLVPLGRLGLYKYVTMDSTYAMALRLLDSLERYLAADARERLEILRYVRGDWSE